jgi:hypothetical protein
MSDLFQLLVVGLVVLAAALYLVRAMWKAMVSKTGTGCGSGCGKCSAPIPEPKQEGRFPLPQA